MLKKEQPTLTQKWNKIFDAKASFTFDKETKKVTGNDSVEFLIKLEDSIEEILCYDADLIKGTLLHLGNISEKIAYGNSIFINQNFSA